MEKRQKEKLQISGGKKNKLKLKVLKYNGSRIPRGYYI
jgi:hypothetical protein